jgi:hypothetical protein
MDGTVVVHDRYQNYDAAEFGGLIHQLCCQHYPDTAVMPIRRRPPLVAGVTGLAVSA